MKGSSASRLLAFSVIGLLAASVSTAAGAAIVLRGDFSGVVNSAGVPFAGGVGSTFTGYYEYDDASPALGPAPGVFASGTAYAALSFVIDGAPVGPSPVVAIADDYGGVYDILWVLTGPTGYPGLQLVGPSSLWTGESLSVLDGVSLSDFSSAFLNGVSRSGLIDGSIQTWSQSAVGVPEPGTLALLGLGLAGLAAARRRKQ